MLCVSDLIFDAVQNYLADAYGEYASSAISAQGFVRNMLAASFPLYGRQMFQNLHYQWAGTLCALIGVVMIPLPVRLLLLSSVLSAAGLTISRLIVSSLFL